MTMIRRQIFAAASLIVMCSAVGARAEEPVICTDRPTNANAVCTVPEGRFQIEADLVSKSVFEEDSVDREVLLLPNPTLKYGLTDRSDIQVNFQPNIRVTVETPFGETEDTGVGDLLIRYKHRLSADNAKVGYAIIPFVRAPTSDAGFGNDSWSGGVALPVSIALPAQFTLVTSPQVDVIPDSNGSGHHLGLVNLVNLGRPITENLTVYAELYAANDFDPDDESHVYTADFAAAYLVTNRVQIDAGVNLGLGDDAADRQVYAGLSVLF